MSVFVSLISPSTPPGSWTRTRLSSPAWRILSGCRSSPGRTPRQSRAWRCGPGSQPKKQQQHKFDGSLTAVWRHDTLFFLAVGQASSCIIIRLAETKYLLNKNAWLSNLFVVHFDKKNTTSCLRSLCRTAGPSQQRTYHPLPGACRQPMTGKRRKFHTVTF